MKIFNEIKLFFDSPPSFILSIINIFGFSEKVKSNLAASALVIVSLWLITFVVTRVVFRYLTDIQIRYRIRKITSFTTAVLSILFLGRIWFAGFESIMTLLGFFSAGIAISLKDPIMNIAGWFYITWRKVFDVGDRIQMESNMGDVIDISIFKFSILEIGNWVDGDQSTGRIIHIPNGKVFFQSLANYNQGFSHIWNELHIVITFESNWKKAKQLLTDIANKWSIHLTKEAETQIKEASKRYMIFYSNLTPIVYTSVKKDGVGLAVRYLCEPRKRRGTAAVLWEDILSEFSSHDDIQFAYSTTRFYTNEVLTENESG
jgi:small-conductance mechanosensitive channel